MPLETFFFLSEFETKLYLGKVYLGDCVSKINFNMHVMTLEPFIFNIKKIVN